MKKKKMLNHKGRHDTTLGSNMVQEFKINQRRLLIDSLEIGIPAPEQMIALGERELPNGVKVGQLLNSKTLNYKKFTPHRDGLFCERIFGPVQSFVCACGKRKESIQSKSKHKDTVLGKADKSQVLSSRQVNLLPQPAGTRVSETALLSETEIPFCPKCQVEYISKNVRRHRLGYIKLFAPVAHIWYLKGRPSYVSLFLGKRKKAMTSLAYCNAYLVELAYSDFQRQNQLKDTDKSLTSLVENSNATIRQDPYFNDGFDSKYACHSFDHRNAVSMRDAFDSSATLRDREESFASSNLFTNTGKVDRVPTVKPFFDLLKQLFPDTFKINIKNDSAELPRYAQSKFRFYKRKVINRQKTRLNSVDFFGFSDRFISNLTTTIPEHAKQKGLHSIQLESELKFKTILKLEKAYLSKSVLGASAINKAFSKYVGVRTLGRTYKKTEIGLQNQMLPESTFGTFVRDFPASIKSSRHRSEIGLGTKKLFYASTDQVSIKRGQNEKQQSGNKVLPKKRPFFFTCLEKGRTPCSPPLERDLRCLHPVQPSRPPYIRAQTLPFLPSLICSFHLRDCLISFLQSLPCTDDIPIPIHCQTPRRYPLRDVHKFLAELRSTNGLYNVERLTSESIAKFIGVSKGSHVTPPPYPEMGNVSSVPLNKTILNNDLKQSSQKTMCQPPTAYSPFLTSTLVLKKYNRNIVIHKRFTNSSYQKRSDDFRLTSLKEGKRDFSAKTNSVDSLPSLVFVPFASQFLHQALTPQSYRYSKGNVFKKELCFPRTGVNTSKVLFSTSQSSSLCVDDRSAFSTHQNLKGRGKDLLVFGMTERIPSSSFLYPSWLSKPNAIETPTRFWRAQLKTENGESVTLSTNFENNVSKRYRQLENPFLIKGLLEHTYKKTQMGYFLFTKSTQNKVLQQSTLDAFTHPLTKQKIVCQSRINTPDLQLNKMKSFDGKITELQRNDQINLSDLTLLPLNITLTGSFVNRRLGFLPLSSPKLILEGDRFNNAESTKNRSLFTYLHSNTCAKKARFGNSWYTPKKALSKSAYMLAQEIKISLKGRLLTTFLDMILTGSANLTLPLPMKPFRINSGERINVCTQRKQAGTPPSFEKEKTVNGPFEPTLLEPVRAQFDVNKIGNGGMKKKAGNPGSLRLSSDAQKNFVYKKRLGFAQFGINPLFLQSLYLSPFNFYHKRQKSAYAFIPISLYSIPKLLHWNQGRSSVLRTVLPFSFKQKGGSGRSKKVVRKPSKPSILSNRSRDTLLINRSRDTLLFKSYKTSQATDWLDFGLHHYKDKLPSNLSKALFRENLDTHQMRLLNLVWGTLFQEVCINQLPLTQSSFLRSLSERPLLVNKGTPFYKTFLLEKKINANQINRQNVTLFDLTTKLSKPVRTARSELYLPEYAYLLRKRQLPAKKNQTDIFVDVPLTRVKRYVLQPVFRVSASFSLKEPQTFVGHQLQNQPELFVYKKYAKQSWCVPYFNAKSTQNGSVSGITNLKKKFLYLSSQYKLSSSRLLNRHYRLKREGQLSEEMALTEFRPDSDKRSVRSTSGSETILQWHTDGAKEILLYTGGGALTSLLKRFNLSLFCSLLLGEIQILRKHYKDQMRTEYKKTLSVTEQNVNHLTTLDLERTLEKPNSYADISNIAFGYKQSLGLKYVSTGKNANLFCRRIYRSVRRLKIVQLLMRSKRRPEWMMISILPVLPPDLRPVLQMGDNLIVASDLNTLYQRVIYRNNRHYKGRFLDFHFVSSIHRLVQDAVDRLIENGKGGSTPFLTPGGRPLKSLSDILKGKRGRFRFNLLGKRVDFSGRSVIVVAPHLRIHECGLPREMALELYKYLLIRQLLLQKRVSSIVNAKKVIKQRKPFIWDILREIIYYHPLLLNRAPTLHRLGIQAFQPKLTLGDAIQLHPLVCAGFNADFDGDQMGVHLPLSPQARAEAWDLLWSRNNLLSPATGQPILLPSQEMVLGFYYMTSLLPYGTKMVSGLPTKRLTKSVTNFGTESKDNTNANTNDKSKDFLNFLNPSVDKSDHVNKQSLCIPVKLNGSKKIRTRTKNDVFSYVSPQRQNVFGRLVNPLFRSPHVHVFSNRSQVLYAYQREIIDIHTPIWLKWVGQSENGEKSQIPLEIRIDGFGQKIQIYSTHQFKSQMSKGVNTNLFTFHMRTTVGRVLVNHLIGHA